MLSRSLLGSPEWTMVVGHRLRADGRAIYYADILRVGLFIRRISLSSSVPNEIAGEVALAEQARRWISAYETEQHTGSTDFGELGQA